jgi:hypothetical protein
MSEKKTCSGCGAEKPTTEFFRRGDRFQSRCKECKRIDEANPSRRAKANARRLRWRLANPNADKQAKGNWKANNRDAMKAHGRSKYRVDRYPASIVRYRLQVAGFPAEAITDELIEVWRLRIQIRKLVRQQQGAKQ